MKKMILLLISTMILFVSACATNDETPQDIFELRGAKVGDNNAVGTIINSLYLSEYMKEFELKTKEEPYGIVIHYEPIMEEFVIDYQKTTLHNATILFVLVQNAKWITFKYEFNEYTVSKQELEKWYGKKLVEITSEEEFNPLKHAFLEKEEKVNDFFK